MLCPCICMCFVRYRERLNHLLFRYGHCIPFRKQEKESLCDDFYTSGVDYIYIPRTRNHGRYSRLMKDIIMFAPILLGSLDKCYEVARSIICHFYLPPCGNSTVFELPKSVCEDTCLQVQEACGEEWQRVLDMFQQNRIALEREGTSFIDCADPGKQLRPLPYNCTSMEHLGEKFGHLLYPHSLYSLSPPPPLSLSLSLSLALSLSPIYSQFYQLKTVLCSLQVKGAMWYYLLQFQWAPYSQQLQSLPLSSSPHYFVSFDCAKEKRISKSPIQQHMSGGKS